MKKIITITAVIIGMTSGAKAVVCMPSAYTAPTSCSNYTNARAADAGDTVLPTGNWMVWGCSGGSVSRFAGISYCSSTDDEQASYSEGEPGSSSGKYCWCALTSPAASAWVYLSGYGSANLCSQDCAYYCAKVSQGPASLRRTLFSALGD
jgi:hypothetical protein